MARIVFDLDGTLIDSAPDIHNVANQVLERRGSAPITLDMTRSFIGNGADVFVARMRTARNVPDSDHGRLLSEFMDGYEKAVSLTQPYHGVKAALMQLRAAGHAMGICTNKPAIPTRRVLDHLDLAHYFAAIYCGDSLPTRKPDPTPLHATFDALLHGQMIFVGDSDVDAETGQRAGVPFVLFTEGYRRSAVEALPHAVSFSDFGDLSGIVDRMALSDAT